MAIATPTVVRNSSRGAEPRPRRGAARIATGKQVVIILALVIGLAPVLGALSLAGDEHPALPISLALIGFTFLAIVLFGELLPSERALRIVQADRRARVKLVAFSLSRWHWLLVLFQLPVAIFSSSAGATRVKEISRAVIKYKTRDGRIQTSSRALLFDDALLCLKAGDHCVAYFDPEKPGSFLLEAQLKDRGIVFDAEEVRTRS